MADLDKYRQDLSRVENQILNHAFVRLDFDKCVNWPDVSKTQIYKKRLNEDDRLLSSIHDFLVKNKKELEKVDFGEIIAGAVIGVATVLLAGAALHSATHETVHVKGYRRKDGTYVKGHKKTISSAGGLAGLTKSIRDNDSYNNDNHKTHSINKKAPTEKEILIAQYSRLIREVESKKQIVDLYKTNLNDLNNLQSYKKSLDLWKDQLSNIKVQRINVKAKNIWLTVENIKKQIQKCNEIEKLLLDLHENLDQTKASLTRKKESQIRKVLFENYSDLTLKIEEKQSANRKDRDNLNAVNQLRYYQRNLNTFKSRLSDVKIPGLSIKIEGKWSSDEELKNKLNELNRAESTLQSLYEDLVQNNEKLDQEKRSEIQKVLKEDYDSLLSDVSKKIITIRQRKENSQAISYLRYYKRDYDDFKNRLLNIRIPDLSLKIEGKWLPKEDLQQQLDKFNQAKNLYRELVSSKDLLLKEKESAVSKSLINSYSAFIEKINVEMRLGSKNVEEAKKYIKNPSYYRLEKRIKKMLSFCVFIPLSITSILLYSYKMEIIGYLENRDNFGEDNPTLPKVLDNPENNENILEGKTNPEIQVENRDTFNYSEDKIDTEELQKGTDQSSIITNSRENSDDSLQSLIEAETVDEIREALRRMGKDDSINEEYAVYFHRGSIYYEHKEYQRALSDYNRVIQIQPDNAFAFVNRGNVYNNLKQYQQALDDYSQAIQIQPDYIKAYYNRGLLYIRMQNCDMATQDLNKVLQINPNDKNAQTSLALCQS